MSMLGTTRTGVEVRRLGVDDFGQVAELLTRCGDGLIDVPAGLTADEVYDLAARELWQVGFVAVDGSGRLVGLVVVGPVSRRCAARPGAVFGKYLLVDPSVRGSTVARTLMERVGVHCTAAGVHTIMIMAPGGNPRAKRLYRRYGSQQVTTVPERDGYVRFEGHTPLLTRALVQAIGPHLDAWPGLGGGRPGRLERFLPVPGREDAAPATAPGELAHHEIVLPGASPTRLVLTVDRTWDEIVAVDGDLVACGATVDVPADASDDGAEHRTHWCRNRSDQELEVRLGPDRSTVELAPGAVFNGSYTVRPGPGGSTPPHAVDVSRDGIALVDLAVRPRRPAGTPDGWTVRAGDLEARVDARSGAITVTDVRDGRPILVDEWPETGAPAPPTPNEPVRRAVRVRTTAPDLVELEADANAWAGWLGSALVAVPGAAVPGAGRTVRRVRARNNRLEIEVGAEGPTGRVVHVRPHWLVDGGVVALHGGGLVPRTFDLVPELTPTASGGRDLSGHGGERLDVDGGTPGRTTVTLAGRAYELTWPPDRQQATLESRWMPAFEIVPRTATFSYTLAARPAMEGMAAVATARTTEAPPAPTPIVPGRNRIEVVDGPAPTVRLGLAGGDAGTAPPIARPAAALAGPGVWGLGHLVDPVPGGTGEPPEPWSVVVAGQAWDGYRWPAWSPVDGLTVCWLALAEPDGRAVAFVTRLTGHRAPPHPLLLGTAVTTPVPADTVVTVGWAGRRVAVPIDELSAAARAGTDDVATVGSAVAVTAANHPAAHVVVARRPWGARDRSAVAVGGRHVPAGRSAATVGLCVAGVPGDVAGWLHARDLWRALGDGSP